MEKHKKCSKKAIEKTMKEFENRQLIQSDGRVIKNKKQALAIGLKRAEKQCGYTPKGYEELKIKVDEFFNKPINIKIPLTNIIETRQLIEYYYSKGVYKKCAKYEVMLWHYVVLVASKGGDVSDNVWKELKAIKKLDYKRY